MLIQFNFKNFKGFKNETTLDMEATSITEHPYNLINGSNDEKYIKIAAIYGANASGKSSVLQAFDFMRNWITESFKKAATSDNIPIKRFAFDTKSKNDPAEFEVFFKYKGDEYQYGFSLDNNKIYEEWMYIKNNNSKDKYTSLFERSGFDIECNSKLLKGASNFIPMLEDKTLFLSIISNAKIHYAKEAFEWFTFPVIDYGSLRFETALIQMHSTYIEKESYQIELLEFLKAIDINIEGIILEKDKNENPEEFQYKIFTKHSMDDGKSYYKMPLSEESSGTQKMFSLFYFLRASIEFGLPLFIDELDSKLHPLILRYILAMFHDETINKNNAQLIYATHDNYTLTKDIFRRDQIWFVEKDMSAVSHLYSLVEYKLDDDKKVRKDASFSKDYLLGKYGAVPILRGYDMWREEHDKTK
ncbi:ATP-binding protein (plasmid) [Clostridium estertheticum]|uniref:AAA family ATPase n=1 Tax=Clostridium estertheticum TaxID=238834 RepID=UPI001C7DC31C|nr:ATP-binding protein [Clostridium estertheticum]MBX4262537.1 ATP-binding protein [Clostridium estertheticum]WLC73355.1 ATP-binding protein [Clostridium estertheticum]